MSNAQYKVAQSVMKNALAWGEDDDSGLSGTNNLKIVVIQGMFSPSDFINDPNFERELEEDIAEESKCGEIKKITVFSEHKDGVVIVKFATSYAAQECIMITNGRFFAGKNLKAFIWDGVTNYGEKTIDQLEKEEKAEDKALDEFGDWLEEEQEELPEEFRLQVEE